MQPVWFAHPGLDGHSLLDSGRGEKLERFGEVLLRRPDPQALWAPRLGEAEWAGADLVFVRESDRGGRWEVREGAPAEVRGERPEWSIAIDGARAFVRPTPFKHVGVFPEQAANWAWTAGQAGRLGDGPRLLNLFGYTGVASVLAARAGYAVTHVDASKTTLAWARENARLSGLADDALRIVLDDALRFARREVRRGARYHGILLDPPHFGRGPRGETWRFEEGAAELLAACAALVAERGFVILSTYAIGTSPLALANLFEPFEGGDVEAGELALPEEGSRRLLPCGFCARWSR